MNNWSNNEFNDDLSIFEYVLKIMEQVRNYMELANQNEAEANTKQKFFFDWVSRKCFYNAGQKVSVLLPTESSKLLAQWHVPYEIIQRLNSVDYVI